MNQGSQSTPIVEGSISSSRKNAPLDVMHDIEINMQPGDEGAGTGEASEFILPVPVNGSFLKRSSSKSPKPSPADKKRQQEQEQEDPKIFIPMLARDSDVTLKQRGDKFPSTWTLQPEQSEISLGGPGMETTPSSLSFEPQPVSFVESHRPQASGESVEKQNEKSRFSTAQDMGLIQKVNDVLSGGGGHDVTTVPDLVDVDMDVLLGSSNNNNNNKESSSSAAAPHPEEQNINNNTASSPEIKVDVPSRPNDDVVVVEVARSPPLEQREISFTATDADTENIIVPSPGSFVARSSSKSPMRTSSGASSSSEREINFSVGGSRIRSTGVPKQGSFVGTSPKRSISSGSATQQEINFSPAGSDLQPPAIPRPGSFVERDYDPTRPRASGSLVKERNSRMLNSNDTLNDGMLKRDRNSRALDGREFQNIDFSSSSAVRTSSVTTMDREINFSPGGSELPTAAPPKQGSFVGEYNNTTTMEEFAEINLTTADGGKTQAADTPSPAAAAAEHGFTDIDINNRTSDTSGITATSSPREIDLSQGGGGVAQSPPQEDDCLSRASQIQIAEKVNSILSDTSKPLEPAEKGSIRTPDGSTDLSVVEKVNSILSETSKVESTENRDADIDTRNSDGTAGLSVAREISFSPSAAAADEINLLSGPTPKQGSFVGANPSQISDVLNSTADGDGSKLESTEKKAGDVTIRTSDGSTSLAVAREIDFSPGGGDSDLLAALAPKQGSFVGATSTSSQIADEATTQPAPVVKGLTAAREINFSSGDIDVDPGSPPKQDGSTEASPAGQSEMIDVPMEDVPMEDVEISDQVERETTVVPTVEGENPGADTEVDLNSGPGSDLSSAPPMQGSFEGSNSAAEFSEIALTAGAKNFDPSEEAGQENAGTNTKDDSRSKLENENEEGRRASAADTSSNDAVFVGDIYECGKGPSLRAIAKVETEGKQAGTETGASGRDDDDDDDDDDIDLQSEDQTLWKAKKMSSLVPSDLTSEPLLEVISEDNLQEESNTEDNDPSMHLEDREADAELGIIDVALETSQQPIEEPGMVDSSPQIEDNEKTENVADKLDREVAETAVDTEQTASLPTTATSDMTDIVLDSVETDHDDKQNFRPNESILAMEALLEAALTDDLDSPEESAGAVVQDANVTDATSGMEQVSIVPEASSANVDFDHFAGGDVTENTEAAGGLAINIPENADTAKVDKSIREIEELLDSALVDALETPTNNAPEGAGTLGADIAISATQTEDTDDFVPNESIARIEATLNLGLEDDDLDLDALMADSPRKSTGDQQKHVLSLTDEQNASLSDLLDNALDDEFEINFAEQPESKSKDLPGGPVSAATTAKAQPSTRGGTPKAAQTRAAASKSTRVPAGQQRKETRPTARTTNRTNQAVRKAVPRVATTQPKKQNLPKVAGRSSQPAKKAGPRSLLSGRFSSKPKAPAKTVDSAKPKSRGATRTTDEKSTKTAKKKGAARKLMSKMASWTTKRESESTSSTKDARVPGVPTNNSRQPKSRPTPVALFGGSKAASSSESRTNKQRDSLPKVSSEAIQPKSGPKAEPKPEKTVKAAPSMVTPPRLAYPPTPASTRSMASLSSQCSVATFSSPRREGRRGCQSKFQPFLHESRGPCELCVFFLSDDDKAMLDATGRHIRVMFTSGGCCKTCEVFPRDFDEPPVRLCRQCFFNTHREIYTKVAPRRRLLRKKD